MPRILRLDSARPLREWGVKAYVVVHDIKFRGYLEAVMEWAQEPAAGVLDHALAFLIERGLAERGYIPGKTRYEIVSADVTMIS